MILWKKGLWKFSNSITSNVEYAEKMKNHIFEALHMLEQDNIIEKRLKMGVFTVRDSKIYDSVFKKSYHHLNLWIDLYVA